MKKFCNKITKQQWRLTVPNVNTSIFKKSPKLERDGPAKCGSYDLEEAQKEYDRSRSVPNSVFIESDSSDSENYQDACAMSEKRCSGHTDDETEVYEDADNKVVLISKNMTETNGQFEYDVPKISFSFFGNQEQDEYATVIPKGESTPTHKSEVKIVLASPESFDDDSDDRNSEKDVSDTEVVVETKTVDLNLTKDLVEFPVIMKSGSDPNISYRTKKEIIDPEEDDGLYKVPRRLHRLSQSLNDFNIENIETISSAHSSIEHISCSQVIPQEIHPEEDSTLRSSQNSESMDYCKARSKLPLKLRRATLLRKPKAKAVDTWMNLRSKFNNMMTEHSAQQRVGAVDNKEKLSINIQEVYNNSRDRCKRVLRSTGKIFKKNQENIDPNSDTSSQIIKNHAFFANLRASDIEYKLNYSTNSEEPSKSEIDSPDSNKSKVLSRSTSDEKKEEFDFSTIKSAFRRSRLITSAEGQNGFDDLRRYVKQGGDFCKELATILQERAEAESQYAKNLSKLSSKLARACREGVGEINEGWRAVALELEARAEGHRLVGQALLDEAARPLRSLTENQHRARKQAEAAVDKAARGLAEWRAAEAKSKKHSHMCARDNEKLQDAMVDAKFGKMTISRSTSLIHLAHLHNPKNNTDKENAKLEGKKRKAEDAVKKADIEYYTLCVRAERARLEWESAVLRGASTFQSLEEERLNNLKSVLTSYLHHSSELNPRLIEAVERLKAPTTIAEPTRDLSTFISLRQSSQQISEQLLPDFYCEHITLAMNRERRKQALIKLLHLIRQDIERERKSKNGLENLSKAIKQTPSFGAEDSQQNVTEKLYHMKSMLTYLEGARYKVQSALAELDSRPRNGHPLAPHITITRDKSGLQQSVLKVPQWLRDQWIEPETSPVSEKSDKSDIHIHDIDLPDHDWNDRGAGDGNSNQPDSDFDEFSSQSSSAGRCSTEEIPVRPVAQCRALYVYTPNLPDELTLKPGDILSVYRQQDDGWWLGECNGSVGIFPATYVETIQG